MQRYHWTSESSGDKRQHASSNSNAIHFAEEQQHSPTPHHQPSAQQQPEPTTSCSTDMPDFFPTPNPADDQDDAFAETPVAKPHV
jgi:hypothetical protein